VMLSQSDKDRISAAITEAESRTSGEIFCVLAHDVSHYREVPLVWGAVAALIGPPLLVLMGLHRLALASIFSSWTDDSARAMEGLILRALSTYGLLQASLFLITVLIVSLPRVRRAVTPTFLRRHHVRQAARHHFAAAGLHLSKSEPHVLIFASLADRRVELVAHQNIHKAVGQGPWTAAVAAVVDGIKRSKPGDGFVKGIEICGAALAEHFPSDGPAKNRMPNTILET
jgi:putative membrane protein